VKFFIKNIFIKNQKRSWRKFFLRKTFASKNQKKKRKKRRYLEELAAVTAGECPGELATGAGSSQLAAAGDERPRKLVAAAAGAGECARTPENPPSGRAASISQRAASAPPRCSAQALQGVLQQRKEMTESRGGYRRGARGAQAPPKLP